MADQVLSTGLTIHDPVTGAISTVFEASRNNTAADVSSMHFYASPVCIIENVIQLEEIDRHVFFNVRVSHTFATMFEAAAAKYSNHFGSRLAGQKISVHAVSALSLRSLTFEFPTPGDEFVVTTTPRVNGSIILNETSDIRVRVVRERLQYWNTLLQEQRLQLVMKYTYPGTTQLTASFSITTSAVADLITRNNVDAGGAAFVTSKAVGDLLTNEIRSANATIFTDDGMPEMNAKIGILRSLVVDRLVGHMNDTPYLYADAHNLETSLLQGSGLHPANYQPITVMWEVCDQLKNVETYTQANDTLRTYFNSETTRQKISLEVGIGYGPFSAKTGYEKEMTHQNIQSGYFLNQQEFDSFKSSTRTGTGLEPRITPRGIQLLQISRIRHHEAVTLRAESIVMKNSSDMVTISSIWGSLSKHFCVPCGTIQAFAGSEAPAGWLLCDGRTLDVSRNPHHASLASLLGNHFGGNVPDLRGRTLMGVDRSKPIGSRAGGTVTLTRENIPKLSARLPVIGWTKDPLFTPGNISWPAEHPNARTLHFHFENPTYGSIGSNPPEIEVGTPNPVPLESLPPYTAINFIIKI